MARKRLSDILANSDRERLERDWGSTEAAAELGPIPSGEYQCKVVSGELSSARTGTPGYKLTLEVVEGEYQGRRLWHDIWLSPAALALAKRDLAKLGVTTLEQLERPLPQGIVLAVKVALRRDDDGRESNRITRFDAVAFEPPAADPFAPPPEGPDVATTDADGFDWQTGEQRTEGPKL